MIFALPVALVGLSSLSLAAPTDNVRRAEPPSDWVSEPIHGVSTSSMKTTQVPLLQCNNYHPPVEARAGMHTVWKFCNDNERGSVFIHETTPYANRDDIELGSKECKTHRAASDKHKTFQVCNRGFHALRFQNLKIFSSIHVEEGPKFIKQDSGKKIEHKPAVKHEEVKHQEVKHVEVKHGPKIEKIHKFEKPQEHFEEKHELKHEEKHEFKHEEKHEIKKGGKHEDKHGEKHGEKYDENHGPKHDEKKHEDHKKEEKHVKHEPKKEEKHMINHEEKHDRLKHEEKHVLKFDDKLHHDNFDERYVRGRKSDGHVAKRTNGFWSSKEAKDDFYYRHGPKMHEVKYKNGHIEPAIQARSAFFSGKHEEFREREHFPKERHSKHGKYDRNRDHERVGLHEHHDLHDFDGRENEFRQNHILPRQIPGGEEFRGERFEFHGERDRDDRRFEGTRKHHFLNHHDQGRFSKHHHKEKEHKHNENHEEHRPVKVIHEEPHHIDHVDVLHKEPLGERKHKGHREHRHREHKHDKNREEERHILQKGPLAHFHHNEENRHRHHKHEHKHDRHREEEHHILHKGPLEHLHRNEEQRHKHHKHEHKHHSHKHNDNNRHDEHNHLLEGLHGGGFEGREFGREGFGREGFRG